MDFNLDDPLGDILSEGSNDSFFESTKPKSSSKTAKPSTTTKTSFTSTPISSSKTKIEDLFGIKDTSIGIDTVKKVQQEPPAKPKTPLKLQTTISNDDDDLLADLGFDPKKPKGTKSATSIFDDLLGDEPKKSTASATGGGGGRSSFSSSAATGSNVPVKDESKVVSRQSTETTDSTLPTTSMQRPKTASRKQTGASLNDPLGLFGGDSTSKSKENLDENKVLKETPKVKRKGTTADWLGLDSEPKPQQKEQVSVADKNIVHEQHYAQPQLQQHQQQQQQQQQSSTLFAIPPVTAPTSSINQNAILMATANLETQNALQTLQQQEAQVMMATQIKSQEASLLDMQQRQQQLLQQQEIKFNELLQNQLIKQNQLEMNIRSQQERINAHIQLLMSQTGVTSHLGTADPSKADKKGTINETDNNEKSDDIQLEADVKRLELEKLRLEDLISNVNANHEKEIEFLESSHKKQIKVLEDSLQITEERLQNELKSLEQFYSKKIDLIENEKETLILNYEEKLKKLKNDHETEINKIKTQYEENLKMFKDDHQRMIENIRQSKLVEFAVVQDNQSYLETLRSASGQLENLSGEMQTIRDEMIRKIDLEQKERENKLQAREKRLEDAERRLKINEDASEQEKSRLIELVTTLEIQLVQLQHDSSEERWTFKQKLSSLEVERASFEREKQFIRDQLARDQKRLDELKQSQMDEYQRLMEQIQDEKQLLIVEKAKLETKQKLEVTNDTQLLKTELETAIKVAQDAAKQADQEREKYYAMQRQHEAKKREINDHENILKSKQDELEAAICSVKAKERQFQEFHQKNRLAEQAITTKLQLLQMQMRRITEREAQLSQDRLALSRERLHLEELKQKLEQNKCSLCKIGEKNHEISRILTSRDPSQDEGIDLKEGLMNTPNLYDIRYDRVDNLLDEDTNEFLRKMENDGNNPVRLNTKQTIFCTDFDENRIVEDNFNINSTSTSFDVINYFVPTTTKNLDSEIMMLNFDIKKHFDI